MFYSNLAHRINRFFLKADHEGPVGIVGHVVHDVAKAKFRFPVVFGVKAQPVQQDPGGHPQEIKNIFLAPDVVDDDVFIPKILFDPGHRRKREKLTSNTDTIPQTNHGRRGRSTRVAARRWRIVLAMTGLLLIGPPVHSEQPAVVINEVMWMGSSGSTADEWVELRNLTGQPIDLSSWRLTKLSGGLEVPMLTIPTGQSIPANGYFVVSNYAETAANSVLAVTPNLVATDVALSNTALQISLYDAAGTPIDRADDGAGNPVAGKYFSADKVYASMERNPTPGDGTLVESWHAASHGVGFKDGKPEWGTPGTTNSNGLPAANAGPDQSGVVGIDVNFDGSESIDPEGQALNALWDFGDSTTGAELTPKHRYAAAGEYIVTLTVNDGLDTATDSLKVTIALAPAAAPTTTAPTVAVPTAPAAPSTIPVASTSCRGVLLSELFPNPDGVDDGEFIELYNPGNKAVPLGGCALWVNEKRRYIFPSDATITAETRSAVWKSVSGLSLTNTGGTVTLKDGDGAVLDTISYPTSVENETWAKLGQAWGWTNQPSPGAANRETLEEPDPIPSKKVSTKSTGKQSIEGPPVALSIGELQAAESGDHVRIVGVVTVPVDVLAARTVTVQDDSGATTALLAEGAEKPKLGDQVELIGLVRSYQGRKRISVKAGDVHILNHDMTVTPKKILLDQIDAELADQLVEVTGLISSFSGAKIVIDDGTSEGTIYLKSSTGIVKPTMQSGDRLVVVGVVSAATTGLRILPRTIDDLRVERVLGETTTAPAAPKVLPTAPPHQSQWYWGLVGLGAVAAGVKPVRDYVKKKKSTAP